MKIILITKLFLIYLLSFNFLFIIIVYSAEELLFQLRNEKLQSTHDVNCLLIKILKKNKE